MGYVDGSFPCPLEYKTLEENGVASEIEHEYMSWVQNDCAVMSILAATLSNDALSFVIGRKSSKEIWCRLKEKYVDDSWYNIAKLKTSLDNIQKGSDSIDMYLLRVKSFCDQLAVMGVDMADEDIIEPVLHGLSSEFAVIKAIIRFKTLNSSVSMKDLRSLLLIAEDEINQIVTSMSLSIRNAMVAFGDTSRVQAINAALVSNDVMFTSNVTYPSSEHMMRKTSMNELNSSSMMIENERVQQLVTKACVQKEEAKGTISVQEPILGELWSNSSQTNSFRSLNEPSQPAVGSNVFGTSSPSGRSQTAFISTTQSGPLNSASIYAQKSSQKHIAPIKQLVVREQPISREEPRRVRKVVTGDKQHQLSQYRPLHVQDIAGEASEVEGMTMQAQVPISVIPSVRKVPNNSSYDSSCNEASKKHFGSDDYKQTMVSGDQEIGLNVYNIDLKRECQNIEYLEDLNEKAVVQSKHLDVSNSSFMLTSVKLADEELTDLKTDQLETGSIARTGGATLDFSLMNCRHVSQPMKLWQSLPLIPPG
ncbi:hypothetical protein ACLB2K_021552 [Fragaria x ananassa]